MVLQGRLCGRVGRRRDLDLKRGSDLKALPRFQFFSKPFVPLSQNQISPLRRILGGGVYSKLMKLQIMGVLLNIGGCTSTQCAI